MSGYERLAFSQHSARIIVEAKLVFGPHEEEDDVRAGRRLGRRDANEKLIVEALRKCGVKVHHISAKGFADLIAFSRHRGIVLLEVKSRRGKLTPAQVEHRQDGWPVCVVRDEAEALAACGVVQ